MAARTAGVPDAARFARLRLERSTTMSCAGAGRIAWSGPSPCARPSHINPLRGEQPLVLALFPLDPREVVGAGEPAVDGPAELGLTPKPRREEQVGDLET